MATVLSQLTPPSGAVSKKKRLGRGVGSGLGKTAGRGQKGQYARTAGGKSHFEGGQTPMQRRLPKRGFKRVSEETTLINVDQLNQFSAGAVVDEQALREKNIVKRIKGKIKILGTGELTRALTVIAHSFSKSAVDKIKAAGGKVTLVEPSLASGR